MKVLFHLLIVSLLYSPLFAQQIKIGDNVPPSCFEIFNYKKQKATLSDFKGKLVILDFGTLSCSPCIKLLPHVDEIRKHFKDSIEIFWVVPNSKSSVEKFLSTNKIAKGLDIPVIYAAQTMFDQFEPQSYPYQVWIDGSGKIKARTNSEYLTAPNISWLLSGKPIDWIEFRYEQHDYNQPLITLNKNVTGIINSIVPLQYFLFTEYLKNLQPLYRTVIDTANGMIRTFMINTEILSAFQKLYSKDKGSFGFPNTHILFNVKDTSRYIYYNNKNYKIAWWRESVFSFEAQFPISIPEEQRKNYIINELSRRLNVDICFEKRTIETYKIIKCNNAQTVNRNKEINETDKSKEWIGIDGIINLWNTQYFTPPLLNKTGLNKQEQNKYRWFTNFTEIIDPIQLAALLKESGFELIKQPSEVELMLVTEK